MQRLLLVGILTACGGAAGPQNVSSVQTLASAHAIKDGSLIQIEGTWTVGFENSYLTDARGDESRGKNTPLVWFTGDETTVERCKPPEYAKVEPYVKKYRVRVIGTVQRGGHFGHLSISALQITAKEIEYLDPRGPC